MQFQPPGPPCGVDTYAGEQLLRRSDPHLGWTRRKRASYPSLNTLLLGTTTAIRAHSAVMPPIWPCVHRCTPHGRWRRRQLASAKQACTWQFAMGSEDQTEYKHRLFFTHTTHFTAAPCLVHRCACAVRSVSRNPHIVLRRRRRAAAAPLGASSSAPSSPSAPPVTAFSSFEKTHAQHPSTHTEEKEEEEEEEEDS